MANFLWGAGGARLTPEEIAQQRDIAASLMAGGMDYSPIASPWQGASRIAQAVLGGLESGQADAASKQNAAESSQVIAALLASGGATAAPVAGGMPASSPSISTPMGHTSIPAGPGADVIREGLIKRGLPVPVADGFIMNFKDESSLNPNLNEAQPLVPGSRGGFGLAQWTGPRRVQLEQYAHNAGRSVSDVDTQLDFLMKELQGPESGAARSFMSAKTPQEAAVAIAQNFLRPAPENLERRVEQYGGSASQPVARPSVNPAISAAITNPYISPQAKSIAGMLFKSQLDQQAKANDPMRQLDMQLKQGQLSALPLDREAKELEIQNSRNKLRPLGAPTVDAQGNLVQTDPLGKVTVLKPSANAPTDVAAYNFYADQESKAGRTPKPFEAWDTARRRSSAMSVNTGTIPQGYEQYNDPDSGAIRMRPIPGGPKDPAKKDQATADARDTSTDIITGAAKNARDAISSASLPTTGTAGALLSNIGETGAAEVYRQVDTIKANAKVENLNAMRAASPTGGALGAVSDSESAMLAAKAGTLDPRSPNFLRDLADYERSLLRTIHGKSAGDAIYAQTRPQAVAANPKPAPPRVGMVKGGYRFKGGDPSKKENWEPFS